MSTENVPHVPLPASQQMLNAVAGPSNNALNPDITNGEPPKKKRGRKSKVVNPEMQAAPLSMEIGPNGELIPSTQEPPAKKRRGPYKTKAPKSAAAETETTGQTSATAAIEAVNTITETPATTGIILVTTASSPATAVEASSSQPPKIRKPYTIRVGPDGKPLSDRFKKRLVTGNLGYVEIVHGSQSAPSDYTESQGEPGPSTLYAAAGAEGDAHGEVDTELDTSRFEGPGGLAAFDAAVGYGDEDFEGEPPLSQIGGSSTGPGTNDHIASGSSTASGSAPNSVAKSKNTKMSEAMKRAWERRRQGQVAEGDDGIPTRPNGASASQSTAEKETRKGGGFSVPGNAIKAATKRWSLQHPTIAPKPSTTGSSAGVLRATSSTPMSLASPKRIISISSGPSRDRESTPVRSMGTELLRHRASSLKPRSSLPLHLTPSRGAWSPVESQEMIINDAPVDEDALDVQCLPETSAPSSSQSSASKGKGAIGKSKAVVHLSKQANRPRSSLPSHLADTRRNGSMGPPPSTERPRLDKGKSVENHPQTPEPSRFIQTRKEKAAMPEVVIRQSRHSLPSERASSVAFSQPSMRGRSMARASLSPVRQSLPPPPSQPRIRLVPEIELVTPRRYLRLSPVRPEPVKAEVSPIRVETRPKARPPPPPKVSHKAKPRPAPTFKPKPKAKRNPPKFLQVVIPIRKRRRANLILMGQYDPFRDDDSEDETRTNRYGHSGLRPKVALPRNSQARSARPQAPEVIVSRFVTRGIETELEERYRPILSESTILKRTSEHECGWKGCDAVLASEWHLKRHVETRRHAAQGIFKAGVCPYASGEMVC
jgi:hypothetical protein